MKTLIALALLYSTAAQADMYMNCTKVTSFDPQAPQFLDLDEAGELTLDVNKKSIKKFSEVDGGKGSLFLTYISKNDFRVARFDFGACESYGQGTAAFGSEEVNAKYGNTVQIPLLDFYTCDCSVD